MEIEQVTLHAAFCARAPPSGIKSDRRASHRAGRRCPQASDALSEGPLGSPAGARIPAAVAGSSATTTRSTLVS